MVRKAISCTGVENIVGEKESLEFYTPEFVGQLVDVDLPITKINALLNLLKKAIKDYGKVNRIKSIDFGERLKIVVE